MTINVKKDSAVKSIILLGGTGSVGSKVCKMVAQHPDKFHIKTMVCRGIDPVRIAKLAKELGIETIAINNPDTNELKIALERQKVRCSVYGGSNGVLEACRSYHDICISSIAGIAAMLPTIAAIPHCKVLGIANKESIICAGDLMLDLARQHGVEVIPLDSEHNAIFGLFNHGDGAREGVKKVIITASGGPLWQMQGDEIYNASVARVMKHPTWTMGPKINVDSATMINKGFEIIEAARLFGVEIDKVEPLVHPQSLVHCIINYTNGASVTYMAQNTMEIPIASALFWPEKAAGAPCIDLSNVRSLHFEKPDNERFPLLQFAIECYKNGRQAVVALNAANEASVKAFLEEKIKFGEIAKINISAVEEALKQRAALESLPQIIHYHDIVYTKTHEYISSISQ